MNDKKVTYWKWKSTIIDFDNIKDEKADFGDYLTKKQMIFHCLGCPDDDIHEWYNGGWSCEYNYALSYAKEYGLVEDYIDYEDKFYDLQSNWNSLREFIEENKKVAMEYTKKVELSGLCQGDYPVPYYHAIKRIDLDNLYLDKMNELEGVDNENN